MRRSIALILILCGLLVVFPVLNIAQEDEGDEDTTEAVQEETDAEESEGEDAEEAQEDEDEADDEDEGEEDADESDEAEDEEEITQGLGIGVLLLGLGAVMAVGIFWVGTSLANTDDGDDDSEDAAS